MANKEFELLWRFDFFQVAVSVGTLNNSKICGSIVTPNGPGSHRRRSCSKTEYPYRHFPLHQCFQRNSFCCKSLEFLKCPNVTLAEMVCKCQFPPLTTKDDENHTNLFPTRNPAGNKVWRAVPPGKHGTDWECGEWWLPPAQHLGFWGQLVYGALIESHAILG